MDLNLVDYTPLDIKIVSVEELQLIKEYLIGREKKKDYQKYKRMRGAGKAEKDDFIGKVGEFGAWHFFTDNGIEVPPPDVNVYDVKDKKYGADLGDFIHVKTCSLSTKLFCKERGRDCLSWTWQNSSKSQDTLLKIPEKYEKDLVVLTYVDGQPFIQFGEPIIVDIINLSLWGDILPLLEPPLVKKFIGEKVCLYSDNEDFKKLSFIGL